MIRVGVDSREVNRAILGWMSVIRPTNIVLGALRQAKKEVKLNYHKKWKAQGYFGLSRWQTMKEQEGYFTTPGFFTGTTYRGIDYKLLSYGAGEAVGEVSVYGHWPNAPVSVSKRQGKVFEKGTAFPSSYGTGGLNERDVDDWAEIGSYTAWGGMDPEEIFLRKEAEELGDDEPLSFYDKGASPKRPSGERDSTGNISVGPNGVTIQYYGSKPIFKKKELMRTKDYGTRTVGYMDFLYLDTHEVDSVTNNVLKLVNAHG